MEPNTARTSTTTTEQAARLWSEKEAATFLGVSVEFLQVDRSKTRRIPFIKIGRAVRYDPADVIAYKDRCRIAAVG